MIDLITENLILSWLMNFIVHSTVIIGLAWAIHKMRFQPNAGLSETIWQTALAVGFLTATLASFPLGSPFSKDVVVEKPALLKERNNSLSVKAIPDNIADLTDKMPVSELALTLKASNTDDTNTPVASADLEGRQRQSSLSFMENITALFPGMPSNPLHQIAVFWLAVAVGLIMHLIWIYRDAVKTVGPRIPLNPDHKIWQILNRTVQRAGLKHMPHISVAKDMVSPICLPGHEICIPKWALNELDDDQLEGMLAHELGHLVRRDPHFFLLMQSLERIFFFQPLFRLVHKRLRVIAELAADEWAARQTQNAQAVATTLYVCAEKLTNQNIQPESRQLGIAMAHNHSLLKTRIERLVRSKSLGFKSAGLVTKAASFVVLTGLALSLPNFQIAEASMFDDHKDKGHSTSIHITDDGGKNYFKTSDGDTTVDASWRGDLEFNRLFTNLIGISENGHFEMQTDDGDSEHAVRISEKDGQLVYDYEIDGDDAPFDDAAKAWFEAGITNLINRSGMYTDARVEIALADGGVEAVYAMMDKAPTDYTLRKIAVSLIEHADLTADDLKRFADHTKSLDSDYETRVILTTLFNNETVTAETLPHILKMAEPLDSDYEKRQILMPVLEKYELNAMTYDIIVSLVETMDSDYEIRQIMMQALGRGDIDDASFAKFIEIATNNVESDYELRQIIMSAGDRLGNSDKSLGFVLSALDEIESDYEKRQVVVKIASTGTLTKPQWSMLITALETMDSDHERMQSLIAILDSMPQDADLYNQIDKAAATMGSDQNYGRVARILRERQNGTR